MKKGNEGISDDGEMANSDVRHSINYKYPPNKTCISEAASNVLDTPFTQLPQARYHAGAERIIALPGSNTSGIMAPFLFQFNFLCPLEKKKFIDYQAEELYTLHWKVYWWILVYDNGYCWTLVDIAVFFVGLSIQAL